MIIELNPGFEEMNQLGHIPKECHFIKQPAYSNEILKDWNTFRAFTPLLTEETTCWV